MDGCGGHFYPAKHTEIAVFAAAVCDRGVLVTAKSLVY